MTKTKFTLKISIDGKPLNTEHILVKIYGISKHNTQLLLKTVQNNSEIKICISTKCFEYFYVVTEIEKCKINLLNIFNKNTKKVFINERTTVANIFCFLNFMQICTHNSIIIEGDDTCLDIASGMVNNFVNDGDISCVIKSSPNGLETNSYPLFNFLSNIVYFCVIDKVICDQFLRLTDSKSIIEGILKMAQNPFFKVDEIYLLFKEKTPIFVPSLTTITLPSWKDSAKPNQWTLTIKVNDSGSKNFLIGGAAYVVFDKCNRAWLTNNVIQGTPNSSTFCTILESNGKPASFSPLFGGGLLGAGFGVAINKQKDTIAYGNFGWGTTDNNPQEGSVSIFKYDGTIISPSNGFTNGDFTRVQGVEYDNKGNLWISVWGSQNPLGIGSDSTFNFKSSKSGIVVYIKGNPENYATYYFDNEYYATFDIISDNCGNIYVSNSGNQSENVKSSVFHFRLIHNKIIKINSWTSNHVATNGFEAFRQININSSGYIYIAAVESSRILKFDKDLLFLKEFTTYIDGPWGIIFDANDTMFVSNFKRDTIVSDTSTFDMKGKFGVTIIYNDDDTTAKLVDLPTGGDEIMLANGFPLYGSNGKPSYEPLMRSTGSRPDKVGNLWVMNNWKPSLVTDLNSNPGGDGVVIFIGLATPT
jgi:hypothetical protein